MSLTLLCNCRILKGGQIIRDDLLIENGRIADHRALFFNEKRKPDVVIDCQDAIIAPGYIDTQINGGYGYDFAYDADRVEEAISVVSKQLLKTGVTSFCPTIVTSSPEVYRKVLNKVRPTAGGAHGAAVLGLHLEGPFISRRKKGAHEESQIKDLSQGFKSVSQVFGEDLSGVSIVTLAPELDVKHEVIRGLANKGVVVSMGHSEACLKEGEEGVSQGATLVTHLFNAMLPFHHRDPGLVGLLTSTKLSTPIFYGIIVDGVHVNPEAIRIAYKVNYEGMVLVTDAISAMGLKDGKHLLGQLEIEVKNNKAFIANTDTLCGSICTLDSCVQMLKRETKCSTAEALQAASLHPAKALGISSKIGKLDVGMSADIIQLDDDLNVLSTWINGLCVWKMNNDVFRDISNEKSLRLTASCKPRKSSPSLQMFRRV